MNLQCCVCIEQICLFLVGNRYNKRMEDFKGNLRAYNDYLEEVEEIST